MKILEALAIVNEKSSKLAAGAAIEECREALEVIKQYFSLENDMQAIITGAIYTNRNYKNCLYDVFNYEETSAVMSIKDLDFLLSHNVLSLKNNIPYTSETASIYTHFYMQEELINHMAYEKEFKDYKPKIDKLFKYDALNLIRETSNGYIQADGSSAFFRELLLYKKDPWVDYLYKISENEIFSEEIICLGIELGARLYKEETTSLKDALEKIFTCASSIITMIKAFKEKKHPFIKDELFTIESANFGDDLSIRWGKKSVEMIYKDKEELLVTTRANSELEKIKVDDIKERILFYNKENQTDVDRLYDLLTEEKYNSIRSRLEEKKLPKGFCILLHGAPGTGKTETVYQLAKKTGRDIYHLNISQIKSCWVGESEKNVKKIFETYSNVFSDKKPILLFNEADAIISKRTSISSSSNSSVDKMENSIQNILLEELESFDGIFIATTNLTENIDEAFDRRLLFKLKFDKPNTETKKKIWKSKLEWISDEDADRLACDFDLSGGQINNIYRKSEIDYILYGKRPNIDELISFCKKEKLIDNKSAIGFR